MSQPAIRQLAFGSRQSSLLLPQLNLPPLLLHLHHLLHLLRVGRADRPWADHSHPFEQLQRRPRIARLQRLFYRIRRLVRQRQQTRLATLVQRIVPLVICRPEHRIVFQPAVDRVPRNPCRLCRFRDRPPRQEHFQCGTLIRRQFHCRQFFGLRRPRPVRFPQFNAQHRVIP